MPRLSPQEWRDFLQLDARERRQGLPQGMLTAVLRAESGGNSDAESESGAQGLFQFMPGTAKRFGIDPYDPLQAADGAERYLGSLYRRYDGDAQKALAGYNWGEGNVDKNGLSNLPGETVGYLKKVLGYLGPRSAEAATGNQPPAPAPAMSYIDSPAFADWLKKGPGAQQQAQPPAQAPMQETSGLPPRTPGVERITIDVPYDAEPQAPVEQTPVSLNAQGQVSNADALKLQDAQIARQYGYDPALIMGASSYKPGMLLDIMKRGIYAASPEGFGAQAYEQPSTLGNLALRAGHGLAGVVTGANQLLQTGLNKVGLGSSGDVALADLRAKVMEGKGRKVAAESPAGLGFLAEMAGAMAAPMPAIATGSRVADAVLRGATGAALSQPALGVSADPAERDASYWGEKGGQALAGGVGGGVIDTIARGAGALVRTMVAQSRGQKALETAENVVRHAEATDRARAVPKKYAGPDVNKAYAALRSQGGALVDLQPALSAADAVLERAGMHVNVAQGAPLSRVAAKMRALGNTATVDDIVPLLQDVGKLTRAGDGNTRYLARGLFAGLHDAIEISARELPETDAARQALLRATGAARRNFAVGDMEDIVRLATGRDQTGQFRTLNIAQVIRNIERRFAGDSPRDRLFTKSFSPEERANILGDFQQFTGLRPIAPTTRLPEGSVATLKTIPGVPELARANMPPVEISGMVRRLAYGAAAGSGLGAIGGMYGPGAAVGAGLAVGAEVGAQLFAKALLNPRMRPTILRAINADGSIDPRVYGYIVNQFTQEQPALPQGQ